MDTDKAAEAIRVLRQKRREALDAAREAHPAEIPVFVAIARQAHARLMREKLSARVQ